MGICQKAFFQELEKISALSINKLRAILGREKPLFHMVSSKNIPGLLKTKKILTPFEARARGLLKEVESGIGSQRMSFSELGPVHLPYRVEKGKILIKADDLLRGAGGEVWPLSKERVQSLPRNWVKQGRILGRNVSGAGAGKNWADISVSSHPARTYGNVGIMLQPSKYKKRLHEKHIFPEFLTAADKFKALSLPQVTGTFVYDPKKVSRGIAKMLKAQGGIPLNKRFARLLKKL